MQRMAHKAHRRAYRKVYAPGLAALLVALVAGGCTSGSGDGSSAADAKPGDPTVSMPAPGKYSTLREPCGTVPPSTLKDLLPGVASLSPDQRERALEGTPAVTYDTDRRVGCSWKADSPSASHRLSVDIERVVSYDPAVSDANRAELVFRQKEKAADVPTSGTPSPPSDDASSDVGSSDGSSSDGGSTAGDGSTAGGSTDAGSDGGAPSGSGSTPDDAGQSPTSLSGTATGGDPAGGSLSSVPGLQPRELDSIGDAAFVDDVLTQSGSATKNRTVSVVFRTSNVIVTVTYTQQPTHPDEVPDSKELQDRAQALAKKLVDEFNE